MQVVIGVAPSPEEIPVFCPGTAQCEQQDTVGPLLEAPVVDRHL